MSGPARVSCVVLTCNRRAAVLRLVAQLESLGDPDLELIVVDNGSGDGTAAALAAAHPGVILVAQPENRGTGARNRGLERAGILFDTCVCLPRYIARSACDCR